MKKRIVSLMLALALCLGLTTIPAAAATSGKCGDNVTWSLSGGTLTMEAPFVTWSKAQIVKRGLELGVPYELTWSCYEGGERPCGACGTCIDRQRAFELNGAVDPLLKPAGEDRVEEPAAAAPETADSATPKED